MPFSKPFFTQNAKNVQRFCECVGHLLLSCTEVYGILHVFVNFTRFTGNSWLPDPMKASEPPYQALQKKYLAKNKLCLTTQITLLYSN